MKNRQTGIEKCVILASQRAQIRLAFSLSIRDLFFVMRAVVLVSNAATRTQTPRTNVSQRVDFDETDY